MPVTTEGRFQEAMAPAKRRLQADPGAFGRFAQAHPVDQRSGVFEPGIAAVKLGQRRAGQSIERATAIAALVAPQLARAAPALKALRLAMATGGRRRELRLDQRDGLVARAPPRERRRQCRPLHLGQITQLFEKTPEILRFHGILPRLRIT
jgi:hypothetical protein